MYAYFHHVAFIKLSKCSSIKLAVNKLNGQMKKLNRDGNK